MARSSATQALLADQKDSPTVWSRRVRTKLLKRFMALFMRNGWTLLGSRTPA